MKEQIIGLIKQLGPVVPNELTGKLGKDSFIVSALLSELIKEGLVFISSKKIGSSSVYYLKGQEDAMRKRLLPELKIPEKKTLEFFEKNKLMLRDNLEPQQRFVVDGLSDFITKMTLKINGEDKIFYKHYSIPSEVIYDELKKMNDKPKLKPQKTSTVQESLFLVKKEKPEKKSKKAKQAVPAEVKPEEPYVKVDDASDKFFQEKGLTITKTDVVKKNSEFNFTARTNYTLPQFYFVKYFKKNSLNEADISRAHTQAQTNKMPCLIITTGAVSKNAEKLLISLGNLVNIVKL
ncbi:Uncharacterised protein [Candidatus Tiddalikarchaeum anstoanum]|nr:Uncharacterised protein [Candidatus Tiddalikarchaeum anstoanum]